MKYIKYKNHTYRRVEAITRDDVHWSKMGEIAEMLQELAESDSHSTMKKSLARSILNSLKEEAWKLGLW